MLATLSDPLVEAFGLRTEDSGTVGEGWWCFNSCCWSFHWGWWCFNNCIWQSNLRFWHSRTIVWRRRLRGIHGCSGACILIAVNPGQGRTQLVFSFWWWCIRINLGIFRQSCWATLFSKMRSTLTNRWLLSWVCKSHVIHIGHIRSYELRIALCLVTRNWRWTCCQWGLVWKLLPQCGPTRFFFAVPNQFTWVGQSEILAFKRFQQFK